MKGEDILISMSFIDEELINEAEIKYNITHKRKFIVHFGSLVAAGFVVIFSLLFASGSFNQLGSIQEGVSGETAGGNAEDADTIFENDAEFEKETDDSDESENELFASIVQYDSVLISVKNIDNESLNDMGAVKNISINDNETVTELTMWFANLDMELTPTSNSDIDIRFDEVITIEFSNEEELNAVIEYYPNLNYVNYIGEFYSISGNHEEEFFSIIGGLV